jgi:hypothetical protein
MKSKQSAQVLYYVKTLFVNKSYNNDYLLTKYKQMKKQFQATKSNNPMGLEKIISKHVEQWKKWSISNNSIGPLKFTNL